MTRDQPPQRLDIAGLDRLEDLAVLLGHGQQIVMLPEQPAQAAPQEDPVAKLKQMKELLDAGVVSQEEFDTLKKRLLGL